MSASRTSASFSRRWFWPSLGALALTAWIGWLRAPSISMPMWNVDESIHAAVTRVLLEGGLIYRDAIDQRTPLTYYLFAGLFKFTGVSLPATRVMLVVFLGATGWLLASTVRRLHALSAGLVAALAFAAITSWSLEKGDLYSAHTEWFVAFFTVLAAWLFWGRPSDPGRGWRSLATGTALGLAVLSKQVALLELAPPLVALLVLGLSGTLTRAQVARRIGLVLGGWLLTVGAVVGVLVLAGVGRDFLYYTWTYNVSIYGAEFTFQEKLLSIVPMGEHVLEVYPVLILSALGGAIWAFIRTTQLDAPPAQRVVRGHFSYLLAWIVVTIGETAAGGRGYNHYAFVFLPALCWAAALLPAAVISGWNHPLGRRWFIRLAGVALLAGMAYSVSVPPLQARRVEPYGADPALRVSAFVRANSTPADKLFVWGFNSDIYHYAERTPASRFVYCSFLTGMIPWTNLDPAVDTAYAIVPGAMDDLLADLERSQPKFIIDCSVGPHRRFEKYPIVNFPRLNAWIERNYVEVESAIFVPQGFRLHARRESAAFDSAVAYAHAEAHVAIGGAGVLAPGRKRLEIRADAPTAEITGLGLSLNDEPPALTTFSPAASRQVLVPMVVGDGNVDLTLHPWIRFGDGPWERGEPTVVAVETLTVSADQERDFALPIIETQAAATGVRSAFGASAHLNPGQRNFSVHAPGILRYTLPAGVTHLTGTYGIADGAWADSNGSPTDGVEFIIRIVPPGETGRILLQRYLKPRTEAGDRGDQGFNCAFPPHLPAGTTLELEVTNGPAGDASSDWSHWDEVQLWTTP